MFITTVTCADLVSNLFSAFRKTMHRYYHFFTKHSQLYQKYRDDVCNAGWKYFSNCDTSYTAMLLNARAIFDGSVKSVLPQSMVKNALKVTCSLTYHRFLKIRKEYVCLTCIIKIEKKMVIFI